MSAPRQPAIPSVLDAPAALLRDWVPADVPSAATGPEPAFSSNGAGVTVLLVDDEEAVRRVTRRVLERNGYEVLSAASAAEAIALFAEHRDRIALLLTDVIMPAMNGCELADALLLERPDLPVLLMSGHSYDALAHRKLGALPFSLLHKPFGPAELSRAVGDQLAAGR